MSSPCIAASDTEQGTTAPWMATPSVSMALVRTLVETVEDCGVARAVLLHTVGLNAEHLRGADTRISGLQVYRLCQQALQLTRDPGLGFYWGERMSGAAIGALGHLITHAATLRCGIEAILHFSPLISEHQPWELLENERRAVLRCRWLPSEAPMKQFVAEIMMANFFQLLRQFDCQASSVNVCFEYTKPRHHDLYTRVFESAEHFEQLFTGIEFEGELLDRPAARRDDDIHVAISAIAEQRLLRLTKRTPCAVRVRDILVRQGAPHRINMPEVARTLEMSPRSLRRRLTAEGKTYSEVVNEALAITAKQMLCGTHRNIKETAHELGFSSAHTFHRAFKRWTGLTPNKYRKSIFGANL